MVGLMEPTKYGERFHRLCVNTFEKKHPDKSGGGQHKHRKKKPGDKHHQHHHHHHRPGGGGRRDASHHHHQPQHPTMQLLASLANAAATIEPIELEPNASRFAIFAAVRAAVLESDAKLAQILCSSSGGGSRSAGAGAADACCVHCAAACKVAANSGAAAAVECRCHGLQQLLANGRVGAAAKAEAGGQDSDNDSFTDDTVGGGGTAGDSTAGAASRDTATPMLVPQIVGAGLRGLFELIAEARAINPLLCTKALRALLDVIQGQVPEAFRAEPADMIQPLYELLLDLATMQPPVVQGATASSSSSAGSSVMNIFSSSHHHQQQQQQQPQIQADSANWSAIGCSALLGLCVARGDTGKTLRAIAALLMSPPALAHQQIQLPLVLGTLQRSIVAVALGRPTRPDYLRHGVPRRSLLEEFIVPEALINTGTTSTSSTTAMAAAGGYVYLLSSRAGLLKLGTGFGGTLAGFVYARNEELGRDAASGWIGMCGTQLLYKRLSRRQPANDTLHIVDQQTLLVVGTASARCPIPPPQQQQQQQQTQGASGSTGLLFSDGDALFAICGHQTPATPSASAAPSLVTSSKDPTAPAVADSLVVRLVHLPAGAQTTFASDLTLKLARKNFRTLGYAVFEEEILTPAQIAAIQSAHNPFEPRLPPSACAADSDVAAVACGKEFGLVRSAAGRVYFYGKATALGLKSVGKTPALKPAEIVVSKSTSIVHMAIGHDGIHAVLLGDDGSAYFAGTARRGEDGDSSKNRRQPKASKPKRMAKMEGQFVVHAACNNGTSAFVTKAGKLVMFGKDTAHCDGGGTVTALVDQQVARVALGKAHCVALTAKGQLFTFGLNNKGQCGRPCKAGKEGIVASVLPTASAAAQPTASPKREPKAGDAVAAAEGGGVVMDGYQMLCDFDEHHIDQGQCRVCPFCRECTGYNTSCVVSQMIDREQRQPGANCACGRGEAGCVKCGACATCIAVQENEAGGEAAGMSFEKYLLCSHVPEPRDPTSFNFLVRHRSKAFLGAARQNGANGKKSADDAPASSSANGLLHAAASAADAALDRDTTPRVAPLSPARLPIPSCSPVVQIACGMHHTVVLTYAGECFTFGSNQYGQLGTGDLQPHTGPALVRVPAHHGGVQQVAAGSNHTVLLTGRGAVLTFGNHAKGQLGRQQADWLAGVCGGSSGEASGVSVDETIAGSSSEASLGRQKFLWNCMPGVVNGIGPQFGKKVTWIGAGGDQSFFKIDESLITGSMLSRVNVVADKQTILLIPQQPLSFSCLAISRRDGTSIAHATDQINFTPYVETPPSNTTTSTDPNASTSHQSALARLASADKCNQNVGDAAAPPLRQLPAATAAGRAAVDRMSQSVHEARNQIFDDDQRRKHKPPKSAEHVAASSSEQRAGGSADTPAPASSASHHQLHHYAQQHAAQQQKLKQQQPAAHLTFAMDPSYSVVWSFDPQTAQMRCHNVIVAAAVALPSAITADEDCAGLDEDSSYVRTILSPGLALPATHVPTAQHTAAAAPVSVSRAQASLNMLACLDILTYAGAQAIPACFEPDTAANAATDASANAADDAAAASNEYQLVSRFDNFGGGWGYSGHSVEAIRFCADTDIVLYGFAMFGGRGEYTCKLRLYDLGPDSAASGANSSGSAAHDEDDAQLVAETDDIPYECPARSKYNIMLPRPVTAPAGTWFLVWARISGPSSDCGSAGQATVTTEDQIVFTFATSKKANNGTDVNSGQIPSVLYRVVTPECKPPTVPGDADPVAAVSRLFASGVSRECFESLVALLGWSWRTFKATSGERGAVGRDRLHGAQQQVTLQRLVFVCRACLRLLRKYCNEIYPNEGRGGRGAAQRGSSTDTATAETQICVSQQGASGSRAATTATTSGGKFLMGSSMDATTPTAERLAARKCNTENLQLAECIGDVRALLIQMLCDELPDGGNGEADGILDECHRTFLACFNVFYPTATLKWNCLCDLLAQDEKTVGLQTTLPTRLLSAIVGGLCSPTVQLRHTFQLLSTGGGAGNSAAACGSSGGGGARDSKSIVSPSDNSGLPMLTSMDLHQYPVLVEQMIHRTQQEKYFRTTGWTFKDVLVRLLDIIAQPVRCRIENIYNRGSLYASGTSGVLLTGGRASEPWSSHNQRLIDNCCVLLARVLAEIVYQSCAAGVAGQPDDVVTATTTAASAAAAPPPHPRALLTTGSRFARTDLSRTWNTGNFGPDAVCFSVSRPGIAIAGATVYSGSGAYEYQLELLYDTTDEAAAHVVNGGAAAGSGGGHQHSKWETLETVTGTYDQEAVHGDVAEIKFERAVPVRENVRYAMRLCAQGARTCSGDAGVASVRGPCGATFTFQPCDLSFNGTTVARGQLPCLLYYSSPVRMDAGQAGRMLGELHARDTALQIAGDIGRKCTELLVLARNALAAGGGGGGSGSSPVDKSLNSSNNTQTIDSEQNITPIEEHLDIGFCGVVGGGSVPMAGGSGTPIETTTTTQQATREGISSARDHFSKRIESFSKGIMETLKFGDKRSNNPFEFEIEIGATEIQECPKELQQQQQQQPHGWKQRAGVSNGNAEDGYQLAGDVMTASAAAAAQMQQQQRATRRGSSFSEDDTDGEQTCAETLKLFESRSASIFHTLLPLVFAHVGALASHDPKSSVQILSLIRDILPHVSALNQLYASKEENNQLPPPQPQPPPPPLHHHHHQQHPSSHVPSGSTNIFAKDLDEAKQHLIDLATTSNHYCIVESDHPYRSATINTYRVQFPPAVQWFTIEFDPQCGTVQPEDCLFVSIPQQPPPLGAQQQAANVGPTTGTTAAGANVIDDRFSVCKNAVISTVVTSDDDSNNYHDHRPCVVRQFNTSGGWTQAALVLPGNRVDFTLETATHYARDPQSNKYGFRCLIVGYENPTVAVPPPPEAETGDAATMAMASNACLSRLECELAYLGGMCSANLMRKDLVLPGDGTAAAAAAAAGAEEMAGGVEDALQTHASLLSKGLALADSVLTVNQALDTYLPMGGQSNERQFLKDFVTAAPGSAGARLAAWLQPEPRLDPNRCELKPVQEPVRFGWPTQLQIITRDQYGDTVYIPDLKIEIKATPAGALGQKQHHHTKTAAKADHKPPSAMPQPPKLPYEPTIKDKMSFKAITFMKAYAPFSFEELRFAHPTQTRTAETLTARDLGDLTFGAQWTPSSVGTFCLTCTIDGVALEEVYRIDVKDAGNPPPPPPPSQRGNDDAKRTQPPNKQRRFGAKNSAGLRIRAHPTLQSEQVGIVQPDGVIAFVDEQENDDGVWVRLSTESIRQHCSAGGWYPAEAWCLQYNQHLGRQLLHPVVVATVVEVLATSSSTVCRPIGTGRPRAVDFEAELRADLCALQAATEETITVEVLNGGVRGVGGETSSVIITETVACPSPTKKCSAFDFSGRGTTLSSNPFIFAHDSAGGSPELEEEEDEEQQQQQQDDGEQPEDTIGGNPFSVDLFPTAGDLGADVSDEQQQPPFDFGGIASLSSSMSRDDAEAAAGGGSGATPHIVGQALAGVVSGGAASKLQALHKWFKGADGSSPNGCGASAAAASGGAASFDGRSEFHRKKNELSELASVSVRDLVKAMGGQNGNDGASGGPPNIASAQSSPVAVPVPLAGSCSKSVELSDRSIVVSSLGRDRTTPDSSPGSFKDDTLDTIAFTGGFSESGAQSTQTDAEADATSSTVATTARRSAANSPKYSPRKQGRNKRAAPPAPSQSLDAEDQPKRKTTANSSGSDDAAEHNRAVDASATSADVQRSKRALPSSLAESLRAVFAAFLWHEGIVHDAMACASFLKFHPELPKDLQSADAESVERDAMQAAAAAGEFMTREQRAQQRYSVEVANAGNYLNIRPSTLETLTKSGNSSVLNRRARKMTDDTPKLQSLPELVTVCPPAMRCLVYLWDQICSNCVQIGQSNLIDSTKNSPSHHPHHLSMKQLQARAALKASVASVNEAEAKKLKKKKRDEGTWCELCEIYLPIPVTYHMRIVHPGCEKSARGKGYNSGGTYCEGWAGNCGEGGKGASSWYLMCDTCRDKYVYRMRNVNNVNQTAAGNKDDSSEPIAPASPSSGATKYGGSTAASALAANVQQFEHLFGIKSSQIINSEVYTMMRENSMFLLELSACSPAVTLGSGPGAQPTKRASTVGDMLQQQQQQQIAADLQRHARRTSTASSSAYAQQQQLHRRSDVPTTAVAGATTTAVSSPELLWQAPESFACLESLGASLQAQQTQYHIFDIHSGPSDFERPLSELSVDSMDRSMGAGAANAGLMTGSTTSGGAAAMSHSGIGSLTRFHRSLSMGQGWPSPAMNTRYVPGLLDGGDSSAASQGVPKVVMRRRNVQHLHDDGGSLLLCHPSENLRKLVPESVLTAPAAVFRAPASAVDADCPFARQPVDQTLPPSPPTAVTMAGDPNICLLTRPSMVFILEQHNLERLRYSLKRNLRISTCRIYALQSLNWLMRSVTQPACLHDLMWWFAGSLKPSGNPATAPNLAADVATADDAAARHEEQAGLALDHPITSNQMCGKISLLLTQSFHAYLQTVADLTLLLPAGSALQQAAIQCFGIKFRQADHQFLHRSHVFGNISKILSRSDEQNGDEQLQMSQAGLLESVAAVAALPQPSAEATRITSLADLTAHFDVTVSSRPAMAAALTDGSTETFWESDEEDRNKSKVVELALRSSGPRCRVLCVHIDNSRDIQNRVAAVTFFAGTALGDSVAIRTLDVDAAATTGSWLSAPIRDAAHTHFRIELRGTEATLRVRQVKLLGDAAAADVAAASAGGPQRPVASQALRCNAAHIQQRNCEAETLRVFRLITAQVFGKLILNANPADQQPQHAFSRTAAAAGLETSTTSLADSLDLREHMVGILFSRSKLSHLQKQVIVHIVHAIRKETQRAKEDWEVQTMPQQQPPLSSGSPLGQSPSPGNESEGGSRAPDTYCFEMLSMVLALSGSAVGRAYLSQQHGLLKDLLSLLHTGSDRVQRQVTALLRRMLPEIVPETLGDLLGVGRMPPADFTGIAGDGDEPFDMNRMGILDIFLAVIAKSLQLQTKVKTAAAVHQQSAIGGVTPKPAPASMRLGTTIDLNVCALVEPPDAYDPARPHVIPPKTAAELAEERLYDFGTSATPRNVNEYQAVQRRAKELQRNLNQRWFFRGTISAKQAENIIALVRDMAAGKFAERWQRVTKAAIAEAIVNLTRLDEVFREHGNCVRTATLWLALAALCVLDREHVERLSSGRWSQSKTAATAQSSSGTPATQRPLCANHDDGQTPAVVQCEECGPLCGDCDRFLHLSRKTRGHGRTVCKEEEEAIRVELHESCGRTKLFWLLALADSRTLKAMVEFRDRENALLVVGGGAGPAGAGMGAAGLNGSSIGGIPSVGRCRFCGVTGTAGLLAVGNVCADAQCQQHAQDACAKTKACGHACGGVAGEKRCLPCLEVCCHEREVKAAAAAAAAAAASSTALSSSATADGEQGDRVAAAVVVVPKLTQDADDMCMICFVEALSCAPAIQLECGHVFHYQCCRTVLQKRWNGPRIGFGFSQCPICKVDISHELLAEVLAPINELKNDVKRKAVMRLEYEGHLKPHGSADAPAATATAAYAMDRYAYYVCFKCQKAYYGGEARCDAEAGDKYDPAELVCGGCSDVARAQMCPKHGTDFLEYKCRYCCATAVFFCFGTTHFCDTCHDDFQRLTNIPRAKLPHCPAGPKAKQLPGDDCPLHVVHPPTGEEFALGCGVCRNAQTF